MNEVLSELAYDLDFYEPNEEQKSVGKLEGQDQKAEIGSIIPPDSIVHRMQTGKYDFVYPDFE